MLELGANLITRLSARWIDGLPVGTINRHILHCSSFCPLMNTVIQKTSSNTVIYSFDFDAHIYLKLMTVGAHSIKINI